LKGEVSLVADWLAKVDLFQLNLAGKTIEIQYITRKGIRQALTMLDNCPAASAARRAGGSNGYRWITGPITTVHSEHFCSELAAVARVGLVARRWLSDKNRSAAVVLGNHPISVRLFLLEDSHARTN
jgi:hypothetical protein